MAVFEDHFSGQADDYARYRPNYPPELFSYLAALAPGRGSAWDCGTGSGQAAWGLAAHFGRVIASDASAEQLAHAVPHERIEYRMERAENVELATGSIDLVTVAIAVHWFDLEQFYAVVRRVSRPGGVLAVWTYHKPDIEPRIDEIFIHYYREVLAGYWPARWQYVDDRYRTLPFPFAELEPPAFDMQAEWDLGQFRGFLSGWSASQRYHAERGSSPLDPINLQLEEAWGPEQMKRRIHWPLYLRVGRVP
jgi:SAM-dependent methyltransferase